MTYKHKHLLLIIVSILIALALPFYIHIAWYAPLIIFVAYFLTKGMGSEIGAHRLWCHRSFTTNRVWECILVVLNTLSGEGSIVAFTGIHRLHHAHSDTDKDPHNPHTHYWATIFYQHDTRSFSPRSIVDVIRDPILVAQHRYYFRIQTIILIIFALISPLVLWYYAVNVLVTLWTNYLVDVVCHLHGKNDNQLDNTSKNNYWANMFLLGAGLHNNHHARPQEYNNAWGNYRLDIWGNVIKLIKI